MPGKNLSYNPTGSGAGVNQFIAGQVDFAGSDSPLSNDQAADAAKRCSGNPAWNLPLVFGPVALAYNLPGVEKLALNADVLAKIFTGAITKWNDPAIAALNGGVTLPDTKITPIYRSDSSGTTDNFQKYLTVAAPQTWTKGAGKEFQGGAGKGPRSQRVWCRQCKPRPVASATSRRASSPRQVCRWRPSTPVRVPSNSPTSRPGQPSTAPSSVATAMTLILDLNSIYGTTSPGPTRWCWRPTRSSARRVRPRDRRGGQVVPVGVRRRRSDRPAGGRLRSAAGVLQASSADRRRGDPVGSIGEDLSGDHGTLDRRRGRRARRNARSGGCRLGCGRLRAGSRALRPTYEPVGRGRVRAGDRLFRGIAEGSGF